MAEHAASVAIIMRTRDRPLLLARAVADVCAQTFADWQLVLLNDGGDAAVVDEVIRTHEAALAGRVLLIRNDTPRGPHAALNQGIKSCGSAYIAIHDDDDSWHPEFLQRTVAHLEATADAAVAVRTELVWEHVEDGVITEQGREIFPPDIHSFTLFDMLLYNRTIPISVVYRRAVHDEVGYYREDLKAAEDWEFHLRLALTERPLGFIDGEPLAFWRQRRGAQGTMANSVIVRDSEHDLSDLLVREEALRAYAREHGLGEVLYLTRFIRQQTDGVLRALDRQGRQITELNRHVARLEAAVSDASLLSLVRRRYRRLKTRLRGQTPTGADPAAGSPTAGRR
jgi:glycosyltransferase involved in cell wall biosynthesis